MEETIRCKICNGRLSGKLEHEDDFFCLGHRIIIDGRVESNEHYFKTSDSKNAIKPSKSLLVKFGSIIAYYQEMQSSKMYSFYQEVIRTILDDYEVNEWICKMDELGLLPAKQEYMEKVESKSGEGVIQDVMNDMMESLETGEQKVTILVNNEHGFIENVYADKSIALRIASKIPNLVTAITCPIITKKKIIPPSGGDWWHEGGIALIAQMGGGYSESEAKTLAEREYPYVEYKPETSDDKFGYDRLYESICWDRDKERAAFIKGLQSPSLPSNGGEKDFAKWIEENCEVIREPKITLYRYNYKNEGYGNYILDDIYTVYKEFDSDKINNQ